MPPDLYFDHNGSTPLDPEVRRSLLEALDTLPGNASGAHAEGLRARAALDDARARVARGLGARPEEIWFTSGGTESNNWALIGAARLDRARHGRRGHMVVTAIEHKSVLRAAEHLVHEGWSATVVPPRSGGAVAPEDVAGAMRDDTFLVSCMLANNETGVLQPLGEISRACAERAVLLHTDAVAAVGKVPVDVERPRVDLLSLSAHKLYAPKGVGVLYARGASPWLPPLVHGCGQQQGLRGGTENTAGAVALGRAFERMSAGAFRSREQARLRDLLWSRLQRHFPGVQRNGEGDLLPNTLSVAFPGESGARLQAELCAHGISVAAGAAATNGQASHVLLAMGLGEARARSTLRFSLGAGTSEASIERLVAALGGLLAPAAEARA